MNLLNLLTVNSRQWQESSDEWVKTMHKSRKKKEAKRLLVCDHGDLEWCAYLHCRIRRTNKGHGAYVWCRCGASIGPPCEWNRGQTRPARPRHKTVSRRLDYQARHLCSCPLLHKPRSSNPACQRSAGRVCS